MLGSILISLEDSSEESVRSFIKKHDKLFPNGLTRGRREERSKVMARFENLDELLTVEEEFEKLGWSRDNQDRKIYRSSYGSKKKVHWRRGLR